MFLLFSEQIAQVKSSLASSGENGLVELMRCCCSPLSVIAALFISLSFFFPTVFGNRSIVTAEREGWFECNPPCPLLRLIANHLNLQRTAIELINTITANIIKTMMFPDSVGASESLPQ
jgi:hypothetical protein